MKIEGNVPHQEPQATRQVENDRGSAAGGIERGAQAGVDSVSLSSDARLMASAIRAAERTPAVRQELVDRVRQRMASGDLGGDSKRLADKIIEHLIG